MDTGPDRVASVSPCRRHPQATALLAAWTVTSLLLVALAARADAGSAAMSALLVGCGCVAGGLALHACRELLAGALALAARRVGVADAAVRSTAAAWLLLPGLLSVPIGVVLVMAVLASL
jgi:hypothetical protein